MNGVRCLNCGAQPSLVVQIQAVPRQYATVPIVPDTVRQRPISIVPDTAPEPQSVTTVIWPPPRATMEMVTLGAWLGALSRPSARTMITAAAAGMAVLVAITVSITLG
jgi:hypothetical protein